MKRREFLTTTVSTAAAFAVPALVPSRVLGAKAPSNRVQVGFIGMGNQSTVDLPAFLAQPDVQVVWLDPSARRPSGSSADALRPFPDHRTA